MQMANPRKVIPRWAFWLDSTFLTRGSIETLLDRFDAAGALAVIALVGEAEIRVTGGNRDNADVLDWRYSYLGRRIRVEAAVARDIIHAASELELVEIIVDEGDKFTIRLLRWPEWHRADPPKDPTATKRKRDQRTREAGVTSRDSHA
jgi:hypothetical protein